MQADRKASPKPSRLASIRTRGKPFNAVFLC
nr:MAG TPA: hypothetical protein [Caudoviricetes sp.]